ncbi:hypothetical protein [Bacillus cereus]|uniref:hypothetical protein n=1 Tax=Bacillus cereus TaxID=1396 RepID=UPI0024053768|nr:hypothetical protein [Bacillus cereus]MDF9530207.1 hypothetical protein [Bacillus cereus]MDG1578386.1 hypothetical protein [Bacillus cereus]
MHYIHKVWKLKRNKYRKFSPAIQLKRICGKNRNDNLSINNIRIYENINDLDLSNYVKSDRFSYKNKKYQYENFVLDVNKEQLVNYSFGFFSENEIEIDGKSGLKDINSVTKFIGNNLK